MCMWGGEGGEGAKEPKRKGGASRGRGDLAGAGHHQGRQRAISGARWERKRVKEGGWRRGAWGSRSVLISDLRSSLSCAPFRIWKFQGRKAGRRGAGSKAAAPVAARQDTT